MDFKVAFHVEMGIGAIPSPFTDAYSRSILHCQAIQNVSHDEVDEVCDAVMHRNGLPDGTRTDKELANCRPS